jgi:hypothetical protein
MAYEQKNNTGSLFKNDKRTTDKQPHAKGRCVIEGVEYWVSAWTRERDNGEKWQSLSFTAVGEDKKSPVARAEPKQRDESLPF